MTMPSTDDDPLSAPYDMPEFLPEFPEGLDIFDKVMGCEYGGRDTEDSTFQPMQCYREDATKTATSSSLKHPATKTVTSSFADYVDDMPFAQRFNMNMTAENAMTATSSLKDATNTATSSPMMKTRLQTATSSPMMKTRLQTATSPLQNATKTATSSPKVKTSRLKTPTFEDVIKTATPPPPNIEHVRRGGSTGPVMVLVHFDDSRIKMSGVRKAIVGDPGVLGFSGLPTGWAIDQATFYRSAGFTYGDNGACESSVVDYGEGLCHTTVTTLGQMIKE
jgi:hypothetical protein